MSIPSGPARSTHMGANETRFPASGMGHGCPRGSRSYPRSESVTRYGAGMNRLTDERSVGFLVGFGLSGTILTSWLVYSELSTGATCPPFLGIPACFLVLIGYVIATGAAWFGDRRHARAVFYAGTGLVVVIGSVFSLGQLRGNVECPCFEGLPMCFVSLLAGATMLIVGLYRGLSSSAPPRSNR